ncbi:hypothetical protein J6590_100668 [Homalodisca vitripennis]|nr:hypothetical protein J6590_100668 [Homalodisca vitripennis]
MPKECDQYMKNARTVKAWDGLYNSVISGRPTKDKRPDRRTLVEAERGRVDLPSTVAARLLGVVQCGGTREESTHCREPS